MRIQPDTLAQLRTRTSMKWSAHPDDILPLWVAEMDFPLAEPIRDALLERIRHSDTGYAPERSALPGAFAAFARERWGWEPDPAQIWTTTDVGVAVVETVRRLAAGGGVVINPPVYFPFFELVEEAGCEPVPVPLLGGLDSGWSLDLPGIDRALADGAKAVLLCSPHNPVGLVHSADELRELARIAARHGAVVISDEIHAPLTYETGAFTPFLAASEEARQVGVCVTAASKAWNIAGLKCALMVTENESLRAVVGSMPFEVYWRTSILGLHASVAAYAHGGEWLDGVLVSLDANRKLMGELLAEHLPDVGYRMPDATYLAWLDFRALGWGDDPAAHALEHAKVALSSGPPFGEPGKGFARLNLGCSPEVLTEAITRLAAAAGR